MKLIQSFFAWWFRTFEKKSFRGKIGFGCFSLFILVLLCGVPIELLSPSTPTPKVSITAVPEVSPSPISETIIQTENPMVEVTQPESTNPAIVPSDTPAPKPTENASAFLPGLNPADVTLNLEQRGFNCSRDKGQNYYVRTCDKNDSNFSIHVEVYGREMFSVDFIDSSVLQFSSPDKSIAASFLGFMATMPYDGATQEQSRSWVENTLPTLNGQSDVREKIFAGVPYRLYGIPTAITLEMGNLP